MAMPCIIPARTIRPLLCAMLAVAFAAGYPALAKEWLDPSASGFEEDLDSALDDAKSRLPLIRQSIQSCDRDAHELHSRRLRSDYETALTIAHDSNRQVMDNEMEIDVLRSILKDLKRDIPKAIETARRTGTEADYRATGRLIKRRRITAASEKASHRRREAWLAIWREAKRTRREIARLIERAPTYPDPCVPKRRKPEAGTTPEKRGEKQVRKGPGIERPRAYRIVRLIRFEAVSRMPDMPAEFPAKATETGVFKLEIILRVTGKTALSGRGRYTFQSKYVEDAPNPRYAKGPIIVHDGSYELAFAGSLKDRRLHIPWPEKIAGQWSDVPYIVVTASWQTGVRDENYNRVIPKPWRAITAYLTSGHTTRTERESTSVVQGFHPSPRKATVTSQTVTTIAPITLADAKRNLLRLKVEPPEKPKPGDGR